MRFEGDWTPLSSAENMTIDANKQHFSKKNKTTTFSHQVPQVPLKKNYIQPAGVHGSRLLTTLVLIQCSHIFHREL